MLKRNLNNMAMSLVEVIVGILLLVNPVDFTSGIIVAFGAVMMIAGIFSIIKYFRTEPEAAAISQTLVKGVTMLLLGAFCAFKAHWFIATFPVLTLVYGVVILLVGITKLQWTVDIIRTKRSKWGLAAISAVISILCGIIIITSPFGSTAVLWMFTGISLIVEAVFDVIGSIFSNREKKKSKNAEEV
ncbi:MAG: DUF308 domain-containing protein [Oscillospiraceae bacterium]|nr:DUF308 domain-containing protein [Oscillospiraceae bacterium]